MASLETLTTGAQAVCPADAAVLARAASASATLTELDASGVTHAALEAPTPPPGGGPSGYGATPAGLAALAPLSEADEARSAALAAALAKAFAAKIDASLSFAVGGAPPSAPASPALTITPSATPSPLRCLRVACCGLGDAAIVLLCDALATSSPPALATLDLAANPFGERGALALADLLLGGTVKRGAGAAAALPSLAGSTCRAARRRARRRSPSPPSRRRSAPRAPLDRRVADGRARGGRQGAARFGYALASALKGNASLVHLDLGGHRLGADALCRPGHAGRAREARVGAALGAAFRRASPSRPSRSRARGSRRSPRAPRAAARRPPGAGDARPLGQRRRPRRRRRTVARAARQPRAHVAHRVAV